MQQDIQQIVDFDSAILAHAEWKLKLNQYIIGEGKLNPAVICQDNQCLLGKWIYGAGQRFVGNSLFEPMRLAHARFHATAAKVVEAVDAGDVVGARQMIADDSPYVAVSKEVIGHLFKLKDDITNITAKLIANVEVGFFLIGPDLRIKPSYSKVCLTLLKQEAIENLPVAEALGLSARDADNLTCQISQVFDDVLPEEVAIDQIPKRITTTAAELEVAVRAVRNRDGVVTELLFTIHDITRLVATERENRETRMLLNVAVQKASFRNFLADTEGSLRTAIEAIEVQREEIARRNLHTIKGNSGFYGLDSLVSTIHAVEDRAGITLADIDQVEDQLRSFVDRIEQVTGPLLSSNDADLAVSRAGVSRLEEALARGDHAAVAAAARALVAETDTATAKDLLGPFASACEVLARRFDKRVRLELVNPGVRYSRRTWGGVFQNLVHLLRNAIDHGIEPADERGDKPAEAVIRVEFQPEGIVLSDDGRGIDAAAVVARAIELGAVDPAAAAALPRSQQLALIFVDTLSTARAVTETSGRGVGMGAVKAALERAGGALTVDSVPGGGTTFRLTCAHAARRTQPIGLIAAA